MAGCSGSWGPEMVPRGKRKEVNRSDLFWLRLFCSIWDWRMGGNDFAVNISSEIVISIKTRNTCFSNSFYPKAVQTEPRNTKSKE